MKKQIFTGCATAMITPFTADGKDVDYKAFEKLLRFQIKNDIDAVVISGTTGESPVLKQEEKSMLFRIACEQANDNRIPVIAGTGSNNTTEAVKKSNEAEKQGVNGLLIVTPYYNKCSQEGLIKHYFYIADRVSTPIIVYNVPSRTGMTIKAETYEALSEHKNIVAVKEASTDLQEFNKCVSNKNIDLIYYSGNDELTLPMMSMGAKGVISVSSNIIPEIIKKITACCLSGQFEKAKEIHSEYLNLMQGMFIDINPIPIKAACEKIFNINPTTRLPLIELSKDKNMQISEILKSFKLI